MSEGECKTPEAQTTPSKNGLSEDRIEDYSETEEVVSSAPLPVLRTPPGVAGRFASYLGAKGSGAKHQHDEAGEPQRGTASSGDLISTIRTDGSEPATGVVPGKQYQASPDAMPTRLQDRLEQVAGRQGAAQASPAAQEQDSISPETQVETLPASSEALHAAGHHPEPPLHSLPAEQPAMVADPLGSEDGDQVDARHGPGAAGVSSAAEETRDNGDQAGDSEASDLEQHAAFLADELPGIPEPGAGVEDALEQEPWMSRSMAERDLWERVRPRALRRQAAQVNELRLPAAALGRVMKLHPDLGARTSEALEVVNYATVLLLQAVARAAAMSRPTGQAVQFQDIRQTCLNASELQFMLPANGTLDASALTMRSDAVIGGLAGDGLAEEGAAGAQATPAAAPGTVKRGRRAGSSGAGPDQGQSMLNASLFARHATPVTADPTTAPAEEQIADTEPGHEAMATDEASPSGIPAEPEEDAAECTPEKPGQKRKAPASSKKQAGKAPRVASSARKSGAPSAGSAATMRRSAARSSGGAAPSSGGGIADFFRRSS